MDSIPRYIEGKRHPETVEYDHPLLKDILDVTYGCMVYQEQVMQMVRLLAGYSYGRADLVRRFMAKKKADKMEEERQVFVHGMKDKDGNVVVPGCVANGISEEVANKIYADMAEFAKYAFNKSHAACYADVTYKTAYLKRHYPGQYMAALMTSVIDSTDKVAMFREECLSLGLTVLPPDINQSYSGFTSNGREVRYGLVAIKGIGKACIDGVVAEREANGPFKSMYDFLKRMADGDVNKRVVESLIKCGAFDSLGLNRQTLLRSYESIMNSIAGERKANIVGQLSLFGDDFEEAESEMYNMSEEFDQKTLLQMEKESAGMYLTGHPMSEYRDAVRKLGLPGLSAFQADEDGSYQVRDGQKITVAGIISRLVSKLTKTEATMAFITLEDLTGSAEVIVFPTVREKFQNMLVPDAPVMIRGRVSMRDEEEPKIICDTIEHIHVENSITDKLFIRLNEADTDLERKVKDMLLESPGKGEVIFYFLGAKKYYRYANPVCITQELIDALNETLGKSNVVYK
jgi:DNA polymerase-3 subunit alpha